MKQDYKKIKKEHDLLFKKITAVYQKLIEEKRIPTDKEKLELEELKKEFESKTPLLFTLENNKGWHY